MMARGRARQLPVSTPTGQDANSGGKEHLVPPLLMSYVPPTAPPLLTSSDTRLSMAPNMECRAPGESEDTVSGLAWGCSPSCPPPCLC